MGNNGKGSARRPRTIDIETWDKNYLRIFGKKQKNSRPTVDKPIRCDRMKKSIREDQSCD